MLRQYGHHLEHLIVMLQWTMSMNVSSELAEANFVVYGNNGTQQLNLTSILGLSTLSSREWQFDETGTVSADIKIDISLMLLIIIAPATASKL